MLTITIPGVEFYDEITEKFSTVGDLVVQLEHSLVSLSKWESKHEKAFLGPGEKTTEEVLDYVKMMIVTPNLPPDTFSRFTQDTITQINDYIESKQSATTFRDLPVQRGRSEVISSELIYFWMTSFNIPFACETWHLSRLFALIRIANIKNGKNKKMPINEVAAQQRSLNEQRKAALGTSG